VAKNKLNSSNQLRIIAGKWRGRKLSFPNVDGLRPTPDRVRETVFNWLQPYLGFSHCLDLFAGSGALGFEAASRGAESVIMVEQNNTASQHLQAHSRLLNAQHCQIEAQSAQQFLSTNTAQFDVVFIDPPYQADLWTEIALQLQQTNALADDAVIYIEFPSKSEFPVLPEQWSLLKDKQAGEVHYCLFKNEQGIK
jgi:16S rRNA (guanine966-N2)-methyltransferase